MIELKGKYCKDAKIFTDIVENEALQTVYSILDHPAFKEAKIRCMPDIHQGAGIVIGFTSELTNFVNPEHVGVDIGCQMTTNIFNTALEEKDFAKIEREIRKECPMGFEIRKTKNYTDKEFYNFLQTEMNKARSAWPEMVESVKVDEKYITKLLQKIGMDEGLFYKSISSGGGGNHFYEYGETPEGYGAWTIHCGSRNFGLKVCKYWTKVAKNVSKYIDMNSIIEDIKKKYSKDKSKINDAIKEAKRQVNENNPSGYLSGDLMKGYLTDLFFAQAYAKFNHFIISREIEKAMKKINPKAKLIEQIKSVHNYVNPIDHIIRKGAITAYEGEKMIIPFNMRDGLAICMGKSNPNWNFSAPHGAGRIMSRGKAKEKISVEEFEKTMEGIYSTSVGKGTLDESPMAYKNMEDIVDKIGDTCEILYLIKPKINIKASDSSEE